ncbi:hypothetical protein [Neobacillus mesonae]|uniref:hypothetical protein n=1 Tax=Neobacillus mesonae TaxID=1193713 RepID=UPI00203FAE9D|nr:hypothetical protein [Neobacillus mesonae]MCM3569312.1 hypothetical protein [Neobacillus mesonae]
MGTFTAQILVGQKHSYDNGILNISHTLYLSENSRPAWILTPADIFKEHEPTNSNRVTWIPTLENMLEDALVMIGLYVLKDKNLIRLVNQYFQDANKEFIELYQDIHPENLQELYIHVRSITSSHKILLSVFQDSSILKQIQVLKHYQNDIEVCKSIYSKQFSLWSKQFEINGYLE